jgi:hypothetical protein
MATECAASYRLADADAVHDAVIKNISAGGMLFITGDQVGIGATLELRVAPGHLSIPMLSAIVEVVRSAPVQNDGTLVHDGAYPGYEVGVRVLSMT